MTIEIHSNQVTEFIADNENGFEREHRSNDHQGPFRMVMYGDQAPGTKPYVEYCFLCEADAKEELEQNPHLVSA